MPTNTVRNLRAFLKELPQTLPLLLLALGASLILGFLSFSGMFAMVPVLAYAATAFALAVGYEFEIYFQNIKGTFKKLFKFNGIENEVAHNFLKNFNYESEAERPEFFGEYFENKERLKALKELGKDLPHNDEQKSEYLQRLRKQKAMSRWFVKQSQMGAEKNELSAWFNNENNPYREQLKSQQRNMFVIKAFSLITAVFMTLSSTYLIGEALTVIPWVAAISPAALPFIVLFMSVIAGAAYGLLTFNTISEFFKNGFLNNTLVKRYKKLRDSLREGLTLGNITMTVLASLLVSLAVALTLCTAGTWLTIAQTSRPLFSWMQKMPTFIMGIVNATVTGVASIFFTLENSNESLEMLGNMKATLQENWQFLKQNFNETMARENYWQRFNPIRVLLKLTITPLRFTLFAGHLLSFAFTADRIEHVPKSISQLIALLSEGFEDASYFIGQTQENEDFPTKVINTLASPLYALAALWDCFFSRYNSNPDHKISFKQAWQKQTGQYAADTESLTIHETTPGFALQWEKTSAISGLEKIIRRLETSYGNQEVKQQKIAALNEGITAIQDVSHFSTLKARLNELSENPVFQQQRYSFFAAQVTQTTEDLLHLNNKFQAA